MSSKYLVTGATGLIGRHVTERLLRRGAEVWILVRPETMGQRRSALGALNEVAQASDAALHVVHGDVTRPGLGLEEPLAVQFDHVFHVAGYYDVAGDPERMQAVNVDGTRNVVGYLIEAEFGGTLHHFSSVAVAGDFEGTFPEDEVELGQAFDHPYHRSKYESELLVRESNLKHRIYRPAAVVGHSVTGETDRADGPYYLFKAIQKTGYALPAWFPMLGWSKEPVNMVPVDFVADAAVYIAHGDDPGTTFHIAEVKPLRLNQFYNLVAEVAGAPRIKRVMGGGKSVVPGLGGMIGGLGLAKFAKSQALSDFQIPAEIGAAKNAKVRYDVTNLQRALEGSGLRCPSPAEYARPMWHYWAQHLDPDVDRAAKHRAGFEGKRVLITGASSGIGEALAYACADAGAEVILVARREELLQAVAEGIAARGGVAHFYAVDLSDLDAIDSLVARVLQEHGAIDVLVNNAARSIRRTIEESFDRFHDYQRTIELNYLAPVKLCLGFLPTMRERGGTVVNVLTAGANMPSPRFSAYTSSKAALGAFTDTMSAEFLHDDIFTVSAYFSWVATPMMTATEKYREKVERGEVMTPQIAAQQLMDAVVDRRRRIQDPETARRFVWSILFPKFMTRALSYVFRVYHEDTEAFSEFELDRAMFKRFFKTDLV